MYKKRVSQKMVIHALLGHPLFLLQHLPIALPT